MVGKLLVQAQSCAVPWAPLVCWLSGVGKRESLRAKARPQETAGAGSAGLSGVHLAIGKAWAIQGTH